MTITGIKNNVQAICSNLAWVNQSMAHPPTDESDFIGYPAICHYYADTQSDYATVSQNRRVIEYVVELYLMVNPTTTAQVQYEEMYTHVDNLIQTFDETIDLSSDALSLSPACDIMRPTPGIMERISTKEGVGLVMTIRLFCEADVSFRNS